MAKKAKSLNKLLALVGALLAIVAVVMIFLPQVTESNYDSQFNGMKIAFGSNELKIGSFNVNVNFSFLNLLAYILVVVGLVINVLQLVGIGKGKLMTFIAGAALIAGGILFFFAVNFSSYSLKLGSNTTNYKFAESVIFSFKLGYGAIVGGITAIVSGLCALGNAVLSK